MFFGTTNAEIGFLRDITGNRRFWTVRTPGTGILKPWNLTQDDVDQIWAEALHLASQGEKLFPEIVPSKSIENIAFEPPRNNCNSNCTNLYNGNPIA